MNEINWMQQGWECPKCGAVMSPSTSCCVNCRGARGGGTATSIAVETINIAKDDLPLSYELNGEYPQASYIEGKKKEDPDEQWERYYLNV